MKRLLTNQPDVIMCRSGGIGKTATLFVLTSGQQPCFVFHENESPRCADR